MVSAASFAVGAAAPLLAVLLAPAEARIVMTAVATLIGGLVGVAAP